MGFNKQGPPYTYTIPPHSLHLSYCRPPPNTISHFSFHPALNVDKEKYTQKSQKIKQFSKPYFIKEIKQNPNAIFYTLSILTTIVNYFPESTLSAPSGLKIHRKSETKMYSFSGEQALCLCALESRENGWSVMQQYVLLITFLVKGYFFIILLDKKYVLLFRMPTYFGA
jgi:hypothetical protein